MKRPGPKRMYLSRGRPTVRGVKINKRAINPPSLPTDSGLMVRSRLEKWAVDWFDEHRIRYLYEPLILLGQRQYRPDFYLPELGLFLEICGYGHMPHYRSRQRDKAATYERHRLTAEFIWCRTKGELVAELERIVNERAATSEPSS